MLTAARRSRSHHTAPAHTNLAPPIIVLGTVGGSHERTSTIETAETSGARQDVRSPTGNNLSIFGLRLTDSCLRILLSCDGFRL